MNPTLYLHALATPNPAGPAQLAVRLAPPQDAWERRPELDRRAVPAGPVEVEEDLPLETAAALDGRWRSAEGRDLWALALTLVAAASIALGVLLTG